MPSAAPRALALDTPGLDGKFRLPSGHGARALLAGGRAFAQDAQLVGYCPKEKPA